MYEHHVNSLGREITVPLGDLKLGSQVWWSRNRTAARQRAFVRIRHDGAADFGFGELTPELPARYDTFIDGLHSLYNDLLDPPPEYRAACSVSMGQPILYYLPRIRMVIGLWGDGRLKVLMSRDSLTLEQTKSLVCQHGFKAAYMPDHASKSRLIIPGVKGFTEAAANWISGGATSFFHLPGILLLSPRTIPLRRTLLATLTPRMGQRDCSNPLQCAQCFVAQLTYRALVGLNRRMEQGRKPMAHLI